MTNSELVLQYLELATAGKMDEAAKLEHPDISFWLSGRLVSSGLRTLQQHRRASSGVRDAFPAGYDLEIISVTEQGQRVAIEARGNGILKDGTSYQPDYAMFATVEDGRITGLREYIDTEKVAATFAIPIRTT